MLCEMPSTDLRSRRMTRLPPPTRLQIVLVGMTCEGTTDGTLNGPADEMYVELSSLGGPASSRGLKKRVELGDWKEGDTRVLNRVLFDGPPQEWPYYRLTFGDNDDLQNDDIVGMVRGEVTEVEIRNNINWFFITLMAWTPERSCAEISQAQSGPFARKNQFYLDGEGGRYRVFLEGVLT